MQTPSEWQSMLDHLMPSIEERGRRVEAQDLSASRLECSLSDGSVLRIRHGPTQMEPVLVFLFTPHHIPGAEYRKRWGYRVRMPQQLERYLHHIDMEEDLEAEEDTLSTCSDATSMDAELEE